MSLPDHLVDLIIGKLEGEGGMKSLANNLIREWGRLTASEMGGLAAWTHRELHDPLSSSYAITPHSLPGLQDAVLLNCHGLIANFLVPGAFTSLRRVHIGDEYLPVTEQASIQKRQATWAALLKLPQLCQLSGACELFDVGMKLSLGMWQEVDYPEGAMADFQRVFPLPGCGSESEASKVQPGPEVY